eukprot:gene8448-10377_t
MKYTLTLNEDVTIPPHLLVPVFSKYSNHPNIQYLESLRITIFNGNVDIFPLLVSNIKPILVSLSSLIISFSFKNSELTMELADKIRIPSGSIGNTVKTMDIWFYNGPDESSSQREVLERILEVGSIPDSCENLTIEYFLIQHNPLGLIPSSVKELYVNKWNSKESDMYMVPKSVVKLALVSHREFDDSPKFSDTCFPPSITDLDMSNGYFPFLRKEAIPNSVKRLNINFTDGPIPIGFIPSSVERFESYCYYDIKPGMIPEGVKEVKINLNCDEPFEKGFIPNSVTKLSLNLNYESDNEGEVYDTILPRGLTHLLTQYINVRFSQPTDGGQHHFTNLTHLDCQLPKIEVGMLPPTLKKLIISFHPNLCVIPPGALPQSLKHLEMYFHQDQTFTKEVLPNQLKTLVLRTSFKNKHEIPFDELDFEIPPSLQRLGLPSMTRPEVTLLRLSQFMNRLFNNAKSRFEIKIYSTDFTSFDSKDPYLYYQSSFSYLNDGFLQKSNLYQFLSFNEKKKITNIPTAIWDC